MPICSIEYVDFKVAQKIPQDVTNKFRNGWSSTEELISSLLNEEQGGKFINFSIGKITCMLCNNTASTDVRDLDIGLTLVISNPTLIASNDIGVFLSFVLPLCIKKIQKIVKIAKHISEVSEKEMKGLIIEILDNEMKKLYLLIIFNSYLYHFYRELVQSDGEKLITDYMDVSNDCITYTFFYKHICIYYSINKEIYMARYRTSP